jgi:hypothetical protein
VSAAKTRIMYIQRGTEPGSVEMQPPPEKTEKSKKAKKPARERHLRSLP